jgi:two-component system, cell cycle sensor histidine kinase and response regulator CckA
MEKKGSIEKSSLRKQADQVLKGNLKMKKDLPDIKSEAGKDLIHELQVHQIELQMQNEELRCIQSELEKSRDKYSHLYDFSPVGYFTVSEKGIIEEANLTAAVMLGIERKKIIGKPFTHFIKRDDQDIFYKHRQSILDTESTHSCELRFVKKEGIEFYASLACAVIKESEGAKQLRIAVNDITERKAAEVDLELFQDLLNRSNDAIYISDPVTGRFLNVNEKACSDLKYSRTEFLNLKLSDIDPLIPDSFSWKKFIIDLKTKGSMLQEREHKRSDGSVFPVEVSAKLIKHGNKEYIAAIVRDLTERKAFEDRLRHAQKMESIGALTGGIAHEFNNILGIILGYTELSLLDISEGNPANDYLKEVHSASLRAKEVVHQMLSFSHKSSGEYSIVHISPIIRDAIKLIRASIPKNINIIHNVPDKSHVVLGDPSQIKEIIINLCTNAKYAMKEKGGTLEINMEHTILDKNSASIYESLIPGNFVKLIVRDTGHGIDPNTINRIFEPYFTTKSYSEGLGMGLAVVYGIVRAHKGAIRVESEIGKGTVVEVLFPCSEMSEEISETREIETHGRCNEHVLFVDDEVQIVKLNKMILEKNGYTVTATTSSSKALETFKADPQSFDILITDIAMPDISGDDLVREIKKIRPGIPVIICTGFSEKMSEEDAKEQGIAKYLKKPTGKDALLKALRSVLDQ